MSNKPQSIKIDELLDRLAHLRKFAERIELISRTSGAQC